VHFLRVADERVVKYEIYYSSANFNLYIPLKETRDESDIRQKHSLKSFGKNCPHYVKLLKTIATVIAQK